MYLPQTLKKFAMNLIERVKLSEGGAIGRYRTQAHGYFAFPKLEGPIGPNMVFRGRTVLNWSLNNYLGLANNPEVRLADTEAAAHYGLACPMGARMMSGHSSLHEELERRVARFVGKPDAFLLNFGYQGMVSIIDSLLTRHDVAVYDSEAHACIVDGLRLHSGRRILFPHNNIEALHRALQRAQTIVESTGGGILVITEGVFGMRGDLGALDQIVGLKKHYDFTLLVDDAHGLGVMGDEGRGTAEHFGVTDGVDIIFATFAKAMAGIGAFVASEKVVSDFLRYNMRSQIFAKSLPSAMVSGAIRRLEIIEAHPEYREQLWRTARLLQIGLKERGFDIGNTASPVTPVYFSGKVEEAANMVVDLRERYGIFCSVVAYPVVPREVIMLRLIPTASHTDSDVHRTLEAFEQCRTRLEEGLYDREMPQMADKEFA